MQVKHVTILGTFFLFQKRCRDESLLIRKQSAESISKILLLNSSRCTDALDRSWLLSVLPLITDREESVAKRAAELITVCVKVFVVKFYELL